MKLISANSDPVSDLKLESLYSNRLIPIEKKPFLIDANGCLGPFLRVESGGYILDLASQIASCGLGFSPGVLFGACQYLESWLGQTDTHTMGQVKTAFTELLQRKTGSEQFKAHFCGSGAEAIEIGLGFCLEQFQGTRKKILAFENSFHGRLLVALSCTWNKAKREPFAWPQFQTEFLPYPEMIGDDVRQCQPNDDDRDLLDRETEILTGIERRLAGNDFFAVLIEPMQCEGGERYSSARFHNRLAEVCRKHGVPLVYDEIQTGFGLGGDFFWHRKFDLRESNGKPAFPDVVISAKKAQVGIVLSKLSHSMELDEQFNSASLIRGYIQGSMLDQYQDQIESIDKQIREHLNALVDKHDGLIARPRVQGFCFAFDFHDAEICKAFINKRFEYGLLFYPAGDRTARFRLNLAFRKPEIEFAFSILDMMLTDLRIGSTQAKQFNVPVADIDSLENNHEFHSHLVNAKLSALKSRQKESGHSAGSSAKEYLARELARLKMDQCSFQFLDKAAYLNFRAEIEAIQARVYEPARQSPIEEFDRIFDSENASGIVVTHEERIVGMAFAGRLNLFPEIDGALEDPFFDDPGTYYMLDLTVDEKYRGGLGRVLKRTLILLAMEQGGTAIHGRNRDQLARGMWAINLSLGSFTTRFMKDSYPDEGGSRSCFYYRCPTTWENPVINLSDGITCPLGPGELNSQFVQQNMGVMINKLTHSNFITGAMTRQIPEAFKVFGKPLRHGYTSSGLSESVDKIAKVFWLKRKPRTKLIAIKGSYWGHGSLLTRSLSGIGAPFFDVDFVSHPEVVGDTQFLVELNAKIDDNCFALFVEPLMTRTMQRFDETLLNQSIEVCRTLGVPVVFNESAGLFHRYSGKHFSPSHNANILPDGSVAFLGGQMGLLGVREDIFADDPLMLISTWDGDAYSLARFVEAQRKVNSDLADHLQLVSAFESRLGELLESANAQHALNNGAGWILGELPGNLNIYFHKTSGGRSIICPSYWQMQAFLNCNE